MTDQAKVVCAPGAIPLYARGVLAAVERALTTLAGAPRAALFEQHEPRALRWYTDEGPSTPSWVDDRLALAALEQGCRRIADSAHEETDGETALVALPLSVANGSCGLLIELAPAPPDRRERQLGQIDAVCAVAEAALEAICDLRGLIEEASEGIYVIGLDGRYRDVNRAGCEIAGYSREQLLRKRYAELLAPGETEARPVAYDRLAAGETVRTERPMVRGDGRPMVVELSGRKISEESFLALARDVTERHAAEQALRESEARYRALTEAAFDAILIHEDGRLIEGNRAFFEGAGYTPEELVGTKLLELLAPEEHEAARERMRSGEEMTLETAAMAKDGTRIELEACVRNVVHQGRTMRLLAARDITERKRAERDLRRLAAERQRLAGQVIAAQERERIDIARELHDHVGQLLAVLKMDVDWLQQRAERPADVRIGAERIEGKLDQLLAVVRDMSHNLRPAVLDDLGLDCALDSLLDEISQRSRVRCHAAICTPKELPREVSTALYRIGQEALANMVRHGTASNCWLVLREAPGVTALRIEHDGADVRQADLGGERTVGIAGMRQRAALLGGELTLEPRDGGGTVLRAKIPLAASG